MSNKYAAFWKDPENLNWNGMSHQSISILQRAHLEGEFPEAPPWVVHQLLGQRFIEHDKWELSEAGKRTAIALLDQGNWAPIEEYTQHSQDGGVILATDSDGLQRFLRKNLNGEWRTVEGKPFVPCRFLVGGAPGAVVQRA